MKDMVNLSLTKAQSYFSSQDTEAFQNGAKTTGNYVQTVKKI